MLVERQCQNCDKVFYVAPYRVKEGKGKYCSQKCNSKSKEIEPVQRFFRNISHEVHPDGCWIWEAGLSDREYGRIWIDGKTVFAHRYSYILHHGPIGEGLLICHTCDRPMCCNPSHLFLGSHQDNMDDMMAKGRGKVPRGSKHANSKLTESQVLDIRKRLEAQQTNASIAKVYGVSRRNISFIKSRKIWKHLP